MAAMSEFTLSTQEFETVKSNNATPQQLWSIAKKYSSFHSGHIIWIWLAENYNAPENLLYHLVDVGGVGVKSIVSSRNDCPRNLLIKLVNDLSFPYFKDVAWNPNCDSVVERFILKRQKEYSFRVSHD